MPNFCWLECDYWGELSLHGYDHVLVLGSIELARDQVPSSLLGEYEFLLDQHRQGFSPREEAEAAWMIAKHGH